LTSKTNDELWIEKEANTLFDICTSVIDNDVKGNTGRGTIYKIVVTKHLPIRHAKPGEIYKLQAIEYASYEFGLLELIKDPVAFMKPFKELNIMLDKKRADLELADKKAEKDKKNKLAAAVEDDPKLIVLIDEAIAANQKAIAQYIAGNEKALNAVVGKAISLIKAAKILVDSMHIAVLIKRQVAKCHPAVMV
jgi:hypothetical protein